MEDLVATMQDLLPEGSAEVGSGRGPREIWPEIHICYERDGDTGFWR